MADLTPRTRSENFLNGEDLEPITRREHFYAGRENELPEGHQEPETREEWFIQKYREAGDVTIESLSITENGTYTAPSGKAYSPVSVNVPLPSNAYLLKSIEHVNIATFADGTDNFLKALEVAIEPVQSGSGDPSPENIRPISGWDEVNVTVADDLENPTVSNVYTISLNGTRYGGKLDVVSGELVMDMASVDLGTLTYTASNSTFIATIESGVGSISPASVYSICENYKTTKKNNWQSLENGEYNYGQNISGQGRCIAIKDERYTSASDFKDAVNGVKFVYELATPLTIQLTPTLIKSLQGANNFFASTGEIERMQYWSKEVS